MGILGRWSREISPGLGLLGGLVFAIDAGAWNTSLTFTTASNATFLGNTAPIWVALGAWLIFGERLRPIFWLGMIVALGGAVLLVGLDGFAASGAAMGNILALSASIAYAAYQLITHRARVWIDNLSYVWLFTATGGMVLLAVSLVLGNPLTGFPVSSYLAMVGLALFSHLGGWLLITYAFGPLNASVVSVTLLGQPIVATLVAAPILGEVPGFWHIVGGLITLAGIYIVHRSAAEQSLAASRKEGVAE